MLTEHEKDEWNSLYEIWYNLYFSEKVYFTLVRTDKFCIWLVREMRRIRVVGSSNRRDFG